MSDTVLSTIEGLHISVAELNRLSEAKELYAPANTMNEFLSLMHPRHVTRKLKRAEAQVKREMALEGPDEYAKRTHNSAYAQARLREKWQAKQAAGAASK